MIRIILFLALVLVVSNSSAHEPSVSYARMNIDGNTFSGDISVAVKDFVLATNLDVNNDATISWAEVKQSELLLNKIVHQGLLFNDNDNSCTKQIKLDGIAERSGYFYVHFSISGQCLSSSLTRLQYTLFDAVNPSHKSLVSWGDNYRLSLLVNTGETIDLNHSSAGNLASAYSFFKEGVWHIWIGWDHLAFLGLLLLAVVFKRSKQTLNLTTAQIVWQLSVVVSAFTLAHTITLCATQLFSLQLPIVAIEAVIALSIVVAGAVNYFPRARFIGPGLALVLGLVHGFGFASVLSGINGNVSGWNLLAFNLGVEVGQLIVIACVVPILLWVNSRYSFRFYFFYGATSALMVLGCYWFIERVVNSVGISWAV